MYEVGVSGNESQRPYKVGTRESGTPKTGSVRRTHPSRRRSSRGRAEGELLVESRIVVVESPKILTVGRSVSLCLEGRNKRVS